MTLVAPRPFTVSDVQKLRLCWACNGIGHLDTLLKLPRVSGLFCGRCAVRRLKSDEAVLELPIWERQKLKLEDTGVELMRKLVEAA